MSAGQAAFFGDDAFKPLHNLLAAVNMERLDDTVADKGPAGENLRDGDVENEEEDKIGGDYVEVEKKGAKRRRTKTNTKQTGSAARNKARKASSSSGDAPKKAGARLRKVAGGVCPVAYEEGGGMGAGVQSLSGADAMIRRELKSGDDEEIFSCPIPGCNYSTVRKGHVKRHMANVHDVGVRG